MEAGEVSFKGAGVREAAQAVGSPPSPSRGRCITFSYCRDKRGGPRYHERGQHHLCRECGGSSFIRHG